MGKSRSLILGGIVLAVMLLFGVSCAKKVVTPEAKPGEKAAVKQLTPAEQAAAQQAAAEAEARARAAEEQQRLQAERQARLREEAAKRAEAERKAFEATDIHFDFDQYVLKPEAMRILDRKAEWLRQHANVRVLIEGHCDERGSNEYNLALGDRRANSAKKYLVRAGVAADRLTTISYGEERPLCTEHNEACWWKNRRAHFLIR